MVVVNFKSRPLCPTERTPVLIVQEAEWTTVHVRTFRRREESFAPARIRTADLPAPSVLHRTHCAVSQCLLNVWSKHITVTRWRKRPLVLFMLAALTAVKRVWMKVVVLLSVNRCSCNNLGTCLFTVLILHWVDFTVLHWPKFAETLCYGVFKLY
jgi:hypothetical protein